MKKTVIFLLVVIEVCICSVVEAVGEINLNAKSAIVFDRTYKKVLYSKNIHEKLPNASTTKVLTAIVAYENADMNDMVTVSKKAASTTGSRVGLRTGDKVLLGDLMKGLLICSGNDAAVAIAEHVAGTEEEFCEMLNEKAKEIGANDTNFVTPHGLDREEHYSTAYDLALISDYALSIPYIANIVSRRNESIKINGNYKNLNTTNEMLSTYNGANGVKTGYTGNAGRCLITSATRDNWQLICVVLGCDTKNFRTNDSIKLLNYCFENYEFYDIASLVEKNYKIYVEKSQNGIYTVNFNEEYVMPMLKEEIEGLRVEYSVTNNFIAPLKSGVKIGDISIYCKDELLKTFKLMNKKTIDRKTMADYIKLLTNDICKYLKM